MTNSFQSSSIRQRGRAGLSLVEVLIASTVVVILVAIACPLILALRESSRNRACQNNLRQLGTALHTYHDIFQSLPPAAVWSTSEMKSLALNMSQRVDLFTMSNWALMILPHTGESTLVKNLDPKLPIAHRKNAQIRETPLPLMTCVSDNFNRRDNFHRFEPVKGLTINFARGNYAINGGSHNMRLEPGSTTAPTADGAHLEVNRTTRSFRYWGNGIAGFNVAFSMDDFQNGSSTLVALEEVRAGIHPLDPRGIWSFGQIGGSVTWAHGVNGDDYGPNNTWKRSDDLLGCSKLHDAVGTETLTRENMPCVTYLDNNLNATARSRHHHGANVLMLDGAIKFVSDAIDPGCWHALHSRETPKTLFPQTVNVLIQKTNDLQEAPGSQSIPWTENAPREMENSLGMKFGLIPSGEFEMGQPDQGFGPAPAETPPHHVRIIHAFYLGRNEITQQQFEKVLHRNPSHHTPEIVSMKSTADFPVEQVSWDDAQEFCKTLSLHPEEKSANRHYRLPTEAEWEYACRAGSAGPYILPRSAPEAAKSGEMAGVNPAVPLSPVDQFPPNAFGLQGMRGNVWEWCNDWFDRDYYARSPIDDPHGPATGFLKVVRGGDWVFVGEPCMIHYSMMSPWKNNPFVGFRVVCEQTEPTK